MGTPCCCSTPSVPTIESSLVRADRYLSTCQHLLDRLRDTTHTHVLLVALPEAIAVHETARPQADLARSGTTPRAWVLNQSEVATTQRERLVVLPVSPKHLSAARPRSLVFETLGAKP